MLKKTAWFLHCGYILGVSLFLRKNKRSGIGLSLENRKIPIHFDFGCDSSCKSWKLLILNLEQAKKQ